MLILNSIHRSTLSACRCTSILNKSISLNIRNYSNEKSEEKPVKMSAMKELELNFNPIYRFPKIRLAAAANKLKNFQAIVTFIGLPVTYFGFNEFFLQFSYTGFAFLTASMVCSAAIQNSIGAVYVHKEKPEIIRIAYIDFWGRRQDTEVNVENIVPLYESKKSKLSPLTPLKFNNNHKSLKFISTNAMIIDNGEFSRIFGDE